MLIKISGMQLRMVQMQQTKANVLYCLLHILEAHAICISSFRIQWPYVAIAENQIFFSQ